MYASAPTPSSSPLGLKRGVRRLGVIGLGLVVTFGLGLSCAAEPANLDHPLVPERAKEKPLAPVEYWRGTITIQAHDGKACAETSAGMSLPYRKVMMLEIQSLSSGHSQGFAWGDMLATRLRPLEIPASTRAGGPRDVTVMGPANFLGLSWLPTRGSMSPGALAAGAGLVFKKEGEILSGRWRERLDATQQNDDQCVWSEATVLLERASLQLSQDMATEARALQRSFELMDRQSDLPVADRWSPNAIASLLNLQEGMSARSYGARTLLPVMSKLAEQLVVNQSASQAAPVLARTIVHLEGLLDQGPLDYAAYVTHLTPLLRMAGMLETAERINRQSVSVLMAQGHSQSPELARLLSGYGALLLRMKALPQALLVYEQALGIERLAKGGQHIGVVIGLVNLSRVCETLGQLERSRQLAIEASDLHEHLGLGALKLGPSGRRLSSQV